MMKPFLQEVVEHIFRSYKSFDGLMFVLPNKRASVYLKKYIASQINEPIFAPDIYNIEELVIHIAEIQKATNLNLLLMLYENFLPHLSDQDSNFESFVIWGKTLLSDFDEIDKNLADHAKLFAYLTANQRLKYWGDSKAASPIIINTLKFWSHLKTVYEAFQKELLKKRVGYQGLIYRQAVSKVDEFISKSDLRAIHFIGFNALNTAEEHIFQAFFNHKKATFWWDVDPSFLEDSIHEAGFFIRKYWSRWPNTEMASISTRFFLQKEKSIKIIGVPKSIAQAKYAAKILEQTKEQPFEKTTAVVLSDETLLKPVLNSLPVLGHKVNVTMGMPLSRTLLFDFFQSLFTLHLNTTQDGWFFNDVSRVLSNPYASRLMHTSDDKAMAIKINNYIKERNILFVPTTVATTKPFSDSPFLTKILIEQKVTGKVFVDMCLDIIDELKIIYQKPDNPLEQPSIDGFLKLFEQLKKYVFTISYLSTLKALKFVFSELVADEQIDYKGNLTDAIQIMGVLESRNLDFDTVILTSVNEGILPVGKNQNSFIPYNIKKEFGLPTYKEKNAIYAYHFYRILHRAKTSYILYNTEPDVLLGNEKSRFITQLLTDLNIVADVTHHIAAAETRVDIQQPKSVKKTQALMKTLEEKATLGFSPSSLANYIRNPYDFYCKTVLGINETTEVEETIGANTFGTIMHDSLEQLYTPLIGQKLTSENLKPLKKEIRHVTQLNFETFFMPKDVEKGQNLIAYHVIQSYLSAFIDMDITRSKTHEVILLALEKPMKTPINIPECTFPVFLKGKLDRLEQVNDTLQILDYKTGKVTQSELEITELYECIIKEKHAKAFQLLCYALMQQKEKHINHLLAGIVPIKTLRSGIFSFTQKAGSNAPKSHVIDQDLLSQFEASLARLILEILDAKTPFTETESTAF